MFSSINSYRPLGSTGWENEVSWNLSNFIHYIVICTFCTNQHVNIRFLLNINKIKISSFVYWRLFHIKCPLKNTLGKKEYSVMRFYFDFFHLHVSSGVDPPHLVYSVPASWAQGERPASPHTFQFDQETRWWAKVGITTSLGHK